MGNRCHSYRAKADRSLFLDLRIPRVVALTCCNLVTDHPIRPSGLVTAVWGKKLAVRPFSM